MIICLAGMAIVTSLLYMMHPGTSSDGKDEMHAGFPPVIAELLSWAYDSAKEAWRRPMGRPARSGSRCSWNGFTVRLVRQQMFQ